MIVEAIFSMMVDVTFKKQIKLQFRVCARLFPHFEPKKHFLKKVRCKIAFG